MKVYFSPNCGSLPVALRTVAKIFLPLFLGGIILWWMYRDFDFSVTRQTLFHKTDWTWMLLSLPFGILAQLFRGWRWCLSLEPLGEKPRRSTAVYSIFLSYASSLVVPRVGEFMRCGILRRWDGVSFAKALGTVVTERAVDMLIVLSYSALILLVEMSVFGTFFKQTGMSLQGILGSFSLTGWFVAAVCMGAALVLLHFLLRRLSVYKKVKTTFSGILEGILSLRHVKSRSLFLALTAGIWVSYFLHYYLTFFCFDFTSHLGLSCGLVTFVVGSFAVLVPTPNGAGPWHFAVKTMLILYGVADENALCFVLIVHSVQTLLVALMGIGAGLALNFNRKIENCNNN